MSGLTGKAQVHMAEQAAKRQLTDAESTQLLERHQALRARVEQLLGRCALTPRSEPSSVQRHAGAPVEYYEHHWRMPVQVGEDGAWKPEGDLLNEALTMYGQIGACTLRGGTKVEYYEVRAYGVPQDIKPGVGPRWGFAPQFGAPSVLPVELTGELIQRDVDLVAEFDACLSELEQAVAA